MPLRIYLAGRVAIEQDTSVLGERDFPGRQGRLAFACLAARRTITLPREELAEVLWPGTLPGSWDTALSAVVSNLRSLLSRAGLPRTTTIARLPGGYRLHLPRDTWIDHEAARDAIDRAEGALRAGDPAVAYGWTGVAAAIARRPFLPGEAGTWIEHERAALRAILVRALDCYVRIYLWSGELPLAALAAEEALALEPFREVAYGQLMQIHARTGNRAEAIRAYERCRRLLAEELGIGPAPQIEAIYLEILRL
jgi:DNA-binding SARP family transcriptional activator